MYFGRRPRYIFSIDPKVYDLLIIVLFWAPIYLSRKENGYIQNFNFGYLVGIQVEPRRCFN